MLALAVPAPAAAAPNGPCDQASDFVGVPGQGPSCRADDLWIVLLETGERVLTHGGDPPILNATLDAPERAVACTESTEDYRNELVYARPIDKAGRYAHVAPLLRAAANQANGRLDRDSMQFGIPADYVFMCDRGAVAVRHAVLPMLSDGDSFSSIVSGLQALGLDDTKVKYWVFYDDTVDGGAAGQGTIHRDDRLAADNANNFGPDYGIAYGVLDARVLMHENAHNLGAVQLSAPHSSGAWHCNDGRDVLCYADGGPRSAYTSASCTGIHFDCGNDDYFNPAPAAGSYLASHWNIGSRLNRFVRFGAPILAPPPPSPPPPRPQSPPSSVGATTPAPARDTTAPRVGIRVAARYPAARMRRRGIPVGVTCSERCLVTMRLVTRRSPRALGFTWRRIPGPGTRRWVVLRPNARGRRVLVRRRPVALTLVLHARDAAGNRRVVRRAISFR